MTKSKDGSRNMVGNRKAFSTHHMRCMGAEARTHRNSGGGIRFILMDDIGTIRTGCSITFVGSFRRALGLSRTEDLTRAVGKEVLVRFGVNGQVDSLNGVSV